ncbi:MULTISPECIES: hypothetical protein [Streptomyces]|uniref:Uncharacterized protein n=1 Tax=Streptomyces bobili TaxID=67280 RepID=A0ABZ1QQ90_9ACTN|nr:hypothetical protein [Streptomyces bobili]
MAELVEQHKREFTAAWARSPPERAPATRKSWPANWPCQAARGCLTESEWKERSTDWLEQALAYVTDRSGNSSALLTPQR